MIKIHLPTSCAAQTTMPLAPIPRLVTERPGGNALEALKASPQPANTSDTILWFPGDDAARRREIEAGKYRLQIAASAQNQVKGLHNGGQQVTDSLGPSNRRGSPRSLVRPEHPRPPSRGREGPTLLQKTQLDFAWNAS
jgi:hypothetical protein